MAHSSQNLANQLFGDQPTQSMGALEAVKEALLTVAPGLQNFGQDVTSELTRMAAQGAHEMAAALFNGSGFVMYPRNQNSREDQPSQEKSQNGHDVQQAAPSQQMGRGGLSM